VADEGVQRRGIGTSACKGVMQCAIWVGGWVGGTSSLLRSGRSLSFANGATTICKAPNIYIYIHIYIYILPTLASRH
jgi:hypothetical protein